MTDQTMLFVGFVVLCAVVIVGMTTLVRRWGAVKAAAVITAYVIAIAGLVTAATHGPAEWQGVAALAALVVWILFVATLFASLRWAECLLLAGLTCVLGEFAVRAWVPGFDGFVDMAGAEIKARQDVIGAWLGIALRLLAAPGLLAAKGVFGGWNALSRMSVDPFNDTAWEGWPRAVVIVVVIAVSWVSWRVAVSRGLNFIGLWDPFRDAPSRDRPRLSRWLVRLGYWWRESAFGRGPSAGWASLMEILTNPYRDGDLFLGRPRWMWRPIGFPTQKHVLTVAETGSGKSTAALIPNLCVHEGSLLCIDPKGELAKITAWRRGDGGNGVEGMYQKVCVLDPFGITGLEGESACYNVFDELKRTVEDHGAARAVSFAEKIGRALVLTVAQKEPIWDNAARTLLRDLVLYVYAEEPEERHNLVRVRELLSGDVEEWEKQVKAGTIKAHQLTPWEVLIEKMRLVKAGPYRRLILALAGEMAKMDEKGPPGSALWTARQHTAFLDLPEVKDISRTSDFLLGDLKNEPLSVYLAVPLGEVELAMGSWLRLFVVMFMSVMKEEAVRPEPPVLLAVDEFPSLGKLEEMGAVGPGMRSYGVRFWGVMQDLGQLEEVYGRHMAKSLIGSAEAVQVMGITEEDSVWRISKLLGEHEVLVQTGEKHPMRMDRPLLDEHQLKEFLDPEKKNQIIYRGGKRPMKLKITPYWEYLPSWYYAPDPRHPETRRRGFWRWMRQPAKAAQTTRQERAAPEAEAPQPAASREWREQQAAHAAQTERRDDGEAAQARESTAPAVEERAVREAEEGARAKWERWERSPEYRQLQEGIIRHFKTEKRYDQLKSYLKEIGREDEYEALIGEEQGTAQQAGLARPAAARPEPPPSLPREAPVPAASEKRTVLDRDGQDLLIAYLKQKERYDDLKTFLSDIGREGEFDAIVAGEDEGVSKEDKGGEGGAPLLITPEMEVYLRMAQETRWKNLFTTPYPLMTGLRQKQKNSEKEDGSEATEKDKGS